MDFNRRNKFQRLTDFQKGKLIELYENGREVNYIAAQLQCDVSLQV